MRISDWSSDVYSSDLLAQLEAIHLVTALVEHRHQPNFGAFAAGGGDVGMHGRAAVAAGLLPQSLLQRARAVGLVEDRSEEHTSESQSLMRTSYAVFRLETNKANTHPYDRTFVR